MTVRSIERLMVRLLWAICLVVITRWLVVHKVDGQQGVRDLKQRPAQLSGRS